MSNAILEGTSEALRGIDLPGIPKIVSGKVREVFDLDDTLLLVATDRLSAFDVVFDEPFPGKGKVLTRLSAFWFRFLDDVVPHHFITDDPARYPESLRPHRDVLAGRSMLVKKCEPVRLECIARGYLAGSGWKEYRQNGTLAGESLPEGLRQADQLPEAVFTSSTKAVSGKDENLTWPQAVQTVGEDVAEAVREYTLQIYGAGHAYALGRGVIIADTKFEFGVHNGELVIIDECLTPDSSRFWPADQYSPGCSPPSFDKQFVRDWLESTGWDKVSPPPAIPPEIIEKTSEKYAEALDRMTR
jgi:phosphoribosylaminoimidazole-succinocarboxamide synthase